MENKTINDRNQIENKTIVPFVDIIEEKERFVLKADMPGVTKDNLNVSIDNNELTIHGKVDQTASKNQTYSEFALYDYKRSFVINKDIERKNIDASLDNGVLTLVLPKSEKSKPRKIEIRVAS